MKQIFIVENGKVEFKSEKDFVKYLKGEKPTIYYVDKGYYKASFPERKDSRVKIKGGGKMRPIKFRFWDEDNKRMSEPFTLGEIAVDSITAPGGQEVWLQFTGLLDKNGKEIWEGDIVKSISEFNSYTKMDSDIYGGNIYQIEWRGVCFALFPEPITNHSVQWKNLEVIGNIYENPELLEGK